MPDLDFPDVVNPAADAATPPPFESLRERATRRQRRQAGTVAVAVVVAIVAVASGVAIGTGHHDGTLPPAHPTPTASPSVVPYAALPPAGQIITATLTSESPAPAPAGTPACRADQLRARMVPAGAAAGTAFALYQFRLVSGPPCGLGGTPGIAGLQDGQPTPLQFKAGDTDSFDGRWRGPVLVDETHAARVRLYWSDALECAPPVDNTSVVITLPGDGGTVSAAGLGTFDTCDSTAGVNSTVIHVGRFTPLHVKPAHWVSSWHGVKVTTPWQDVTAPAGSMFDLRVTLVSQGHDTSLAACPDFELYVGVTGSSKSEPVVEKHQLNCAGVTTVDASGTPYLPADVPVTFDEQIQLPDTSVPKLGWSLHQHGLFLSTGASVTVD